MSVNLDRLGVDRWDTFPPQEGRIRFLRGDQAVASGRYQVVLSFGPGDKYTMGWAIGAYRASGIPFVERELAPGPEVVQPATRALAQQRGEQVLAGMGDAGFLYWCSTLLVIVSELREEAGVAPAVDLGERIEGVARAVGRRQEPADQPLSGPEKRALFDEIRALKLRKDVETALVFVIEADEQEVEMCRNVIGAADVDGLARVYWMLPTWPQRTCLIHLLTDQAADALRPLWQDILRAPDLKPQDGRHGAKALALARLDGDVDRFMDYFDDYPRTVVEARRRQAPPASA